MPLELRTIIGPQVGSHNVAAGKSAMIGRLPFSDICLLHEGVSRRHALITSRGEEWMITDQGSSGGTFLNGIKLKNNEAAVVWEGDLVRVGPWTFRVGTGGPQREARSRTLDDASTSSQQKLARVGGETITLVGRRLRLLTRCIAKLSGARDEALLAPIALEVVMEGTLFGRGAVLRQTAGSDEVVVVASRRANIYDTAPMTFSRSLIQAASSGGTFVLAETSVPVSSVSIAEMNIHSAICAPVMLGEAIYGFLYLDARAGEEGMQHDAAEFCEAVATSLGLSLANFKRGELERSQQELRAELGAAREVQETIMPAPTGRAGHIEYAVRVLPGVFVAGDLFDVFQLDNGATAFFLGDVAGHGAGSGMLMALTQSHLSALLRSTGDLAASVTAVNRYLSAHISGGKFASLWVGVLEPNGILHYADAGHGHWFVRKANDSDCSIFTGPGRGGVPLGISSDSRYDEGTLVLEPGDRVVLYSDGMIEQRSPGGEYFTAKRVQDTVLGSPSAVVDVQRTFDELLAFAGRTTLDDDATIASCTFVG